MCVYLVDILRRMTV